MARLGPLLAALVAVLVATVLAACVDAPATKTGSAPSAALTHEAYVWQRAWTPSVIDAVRHRGPRFQALRVLAAEIEAPGRVVHVRLPTQELVGEVVLVVRIDGAVPPDAAQAIAVVDEALASFAADSDERSPAVIVRALEIDHDCASARLGAYATMLASLRAHLDARSPSAHLPLSITALPAWSMSARPGRGASDEAERGLDGVLAVVDEVVLQVHGVDRPEDGLFSSARARSFVDAFAPRAERAGVTWRVALPAYGSALALDDAGRVHAVESEEQRSVFSGATNGTAAGTTSGLSVHEAWAEPVDVAVLLRSLEDARPRGLAGVLWFRLPVDGDRRAWSFPTLEAVRAGGDLTARFRVEVRSIEGSGLTDVVIVNDGSVDALAPACIELDAVALVAADGSNGFALDHSPAHIVFSSSRPPRVAPSGELVVGWVRAQEVTAHASP